MFIVLFRLSSPGFSEHTRCLLILLILRKPLSHSVSRYRLSLWGFICLGLGFTKAETDNGCHFHSNMSSLHSLSWISLQHRWILRSRWGVFTTWPNSSYSWSTSSSWWVKTWWREDEASLLFLFGFNDIPQHCHFFGLVPFLYDSLIRQTFFGFVCAIAVYVYLHAKELIGVEIVANLSPSNPSAIHFCLLLIVFIVSSFLCLFSCLGMLGSNARLLVFYWATIN